MTNKRSSRGGTVRSSQIEISIDVDPGPVELAAQVREMMVRLADLELVFCQPADRVAAAIPADELPEQMRPVQQMATWWRDYAAAMRRRVEREQSHEH